MAHYWKMGILVFSLQHFNVSSAATTLYWNPMTHGVLLPPATTPRGCNWIGSCFLGGGTLRKRCWNTILSAHLWFRLNWWGYSIGLASRLRLRHCCPNYLLHRYLSWVLHSNLCRLPARWVLLRRNVSGCWMSLNVLMGFYGLVYLPTLRSLYRQNSWLH